MVGKYLGPGDSLLTYLPAAHILEFVFENACLFWGGSMGYGSIRTLSDTSVRNCKGDIRELKPSVLVGVPQVWETVKKGIVSKVEGGGALTSKLFWGAMAAKQFLLNSGLPGSGFLDSVVFNKVKDATGGRLRICLNGGGPISKETQRFISYAITPMISGYGLTETTAMGAIMDPLAWSDQVLGEIPASVEMKLVDFADAGYYSTNKPPQGEIWIRGGGITDGYLDLEEETREAFTEDGWFKTGDIGEFDDKGAIRIIDRKKNLVKTLAGEYIALEKLESVYRSAPVVANICVYAADDQMKPVAIIVPAEPALKKIAKENGIEGNGLEDLVHNEKLNSIVLKQLQAQGTKSGLAGFEIIAGVVMADEEWTPQNVSYYPSLPMSLFPHPKTEARTKQTLLVNLMYESNSRALLTFPLSRATQPPPRKSTAAPSSKPTKRTSTAPTERSKPHAHLPPRALPFSARLFPPLHPRCTLAVV